METVFGQMLALWLGNGDEHRPPRVGHDWTKIVKGNLYLYLFVLKELKKGRVVVEASSLAQCADVIAMIKAIFKVGKHR